MMEGALVAAACVGFALLLILMAALVLVASPPPIIKPKDVFGFASPRPSPDQAGRPPLDRYPARDGEELAFRLYESAADQILIFVHGSSYHGGGYHALASVVSASGAAKVVLPNLRGHHQSGRHRGDVDYIGQLDDDLADLIQFLRGQKLTGPITLGGHSSGGGLVVRFAGGPHAGAVSRFLALSPVVPLSPSIKGGTAGGWASLHRRRLFGLLILNALGIHGFDGLSIVDFNKPVQYWDGTETLSYSYRLNTSYHPRPRYRDDIRALGGKALVLVGADDEAIDAVRLHAMFAKYARKSRIEILPNIDHFGIFSDPATLDVIAGLLRAASSE